MGKRHPALLVLCVLLAGCSGDEAPADPAGASAPPLAGRIAFLSPEGIADPIWVVRANYGERPAPVGPAGRIAWALSWSPGGRRIAYVYSARSIRRSVAVVNVRSGRTRTLLSPARKYSPADPIWFQLAWAPRLGRIAVVKGLGIASAPARIDVVDERGRSVADAVAVDAAHASRISWSPDGRRIAYGTTGERIAVVSVSAGSSRVIDTPVKSSDPAWSPDGRWIAFAGSGGIAMVRPSGHGYRLLTRKARMDKTPTWSPDGRRLAFARQSGGCDKADAPCQQDLYTVSISGGRPTVLRLTRNRHENSPVWAPAGDGTAG